MRAWRRLGGWLLALALLLGAGAIGYLTTRHNHVSDWTAGGRASLSAETRAVLGKLQGPVDVVSYASPQGSLRQTVATLGRLPIATVCSDRCVRDASAVFSMGGYVAGPPVLAAILRRVPVVVMEPNAVPGFTNRSISRLVARALVSFPETAAFFPRGRTEVTGLPVREEFFHIQPKPRGAVLHLLISGGSQGSRTLNHAALQSWPLFLKAGFPIRILHQTGAPGFDEIRDAFAKSLAIR